MRLVGASDAFIRWPFVFEGAFVGLLGALITLGVLAAAADPLSGFMVEFFRVLPIQVGSLIARPRDPGHGRRRRPRHRRLVGVGADLPHPLTPGRSPMSRPIRRTTRRPSRRPTRATDPDPPPEAGDRPVAAADAAVSPSPQLRPRPTPADRSDPARGHRPRRDPGRWRPVHVRLLARSPGRGPSPARRSARTRRSARSGTPTTRSPSAMPAARSTATP